MNLVLRSCSCGYVKYICVNWWLTLHNPRRYLTGAVSVGLTLQRCIHTNTSTNTNTNTNTVTQPCDRSSIVSLPMSWITSIKGSFTVTQPWSFGAHSHALHRQEFVRRQITPRAASRRPIRAVACRPKPRPHALNVARKPAPFFRFCFRARPVDRSRRSLTALPRQKTAYVPTPKGARIF